MKLSFQFELSKPHLPKDYRRGFASIIKDALSRADENLYNFYYTGTYKLKPFTFSVYFPQGSDLEEKINFKLVIKRFLNFQQVIIGLLQHFLMVCFI